GSATGASAPIISACMAPGSAASSDRAHPRSVGKSPCSVLTRDATTQSPAARWGANPPAIPKLMIPVAPRLAAASSEATSCDASLQITATLGPSAMGASSARQVTATTCPRVDIQSSFCSRSAPWCRVNNLPQNVKLVNGLTPDLPVRPPRFRARALRPSTRAAAPFSSPTDGPAFLSGMRCLAILSIVSQPLLCRRVIVSAAINLVPERTGYKSRAYDSRGAAGLQCLNPGRPAQIPGQQARPVHARG